MSVQAQDRRVFGRFRARFPLKFKYSKEDFGSEVFLRDLCAAGARIAARKNLYVNDWVDLQVEVPDGKAPIEFSGRIVWAREESPNAWNAGVKFDKINLMETQRIFRFCN